MLEQDMQCFNLTLNHQQINYSSI